MDDFERSLKKIPYPELLSDKKFKGILQREYNAVTIIDITLSCQKYIEANMSADELKAFANRDDVAVSKAYGLAKQFDEMEQIPETYKVKDIKQTPTYKALADIRKLLRDYQDLAMQNVDNSSQKADEYFVNLKDNLKTLNNSAQLTLIDEIMLPEVNIAVWTHKKFHSDENVNEYQKRWEQLRNSLNAKFIKYKDQLVLAEKESDDIADFNDLAKDLADYVRIDGQTLRHIIRYKELPPEQRNQKPRWMKSYADAACFSDEIGLKISEWNKCFIHHNGKKLCASHRSDPQYKEQPIKNRLSKYKKLFDCK
jgi:hypothetical protein